ncbi:hypothetical protein EJ04DRAFT_492382 [Polyplosphaeria fusca]|uniref:Uncharacterized protein n=1 Tax=Polyplosphaeria fusca TaxID=682080 RepID=A0A9P4V095_9PLEO|nr:hypothetical protein EJ04DRAFT_492382 [Polyplosphaeria fusca]
MSKRNSDGDVLANRLNVGLAKSQRLLASWMGPKDDIEPQNEQAREIQDDDDLQEQSFGPDRSGVGFKIPKDGEDGTFARRTQAADNRLLEQLLGKKAAKSHKAIKQAPGESKKKPKFSYSSKVQRQEESDDEDEGRASAFKSKRRKMNQPRPIVPGSDAVNEEGGEGKQRPALRQENLDDLGEGQREGDVQAVSAELGDERKPVQSRSSQPKAGSYLDEILAERSKKKKKKRNKS